MPAYSWPTVTANEIAALAPVIAENEARQKRDTVTLYGAPFGQYTWKKPPKPKLTPYTPRYRHTLTLAEHLWFEDCPARVMRAAAATFPVGLDYSQPLESQQEQAHIRRALLTMAGHPDTHGMVDLGDRTSVERPEPVAASARKPSKDKRRIAELESVLRRLLTDPDLEDTEAVRIITTALEGGTNHA